MRSVKFLFRLRQTATRRSYCSVVQPGLGRAPSPRVASVGPGAAVKNVSPRSWTVSSFSSSASSQQQQPENNNRQEQEESLPQQAAPQGRRRFYRTVNVEAMEPPWSSLSDNQQIRSLQQLLIPRRPSMDVGGTQQQGSVNLQSRKDTTVTERDDTTKWFTVSLDGRKLKTPAGHALAVPSLHLAHAIAFEWNRVATTIMPTQFPVMTAVCTALDHVWSGGLNGMQALQDQILPFVGTDTVCFYADPAEDVLLHKQQVQLWKPVYDFFQQAWKQTPATVTGSSEALWLMTQNSRGSGSSPRRRRGLPHDPQFVQKVEAYVRSLDVWHLVALHAATRECHSCFLGMALLQGALDAAAARQAGRVEHDVQIQQWGFVEGQHDYDEVNGSITLHGAVLVRDCLAADYGWWT